MSELNPNLTHKISKINPAIVGRILSMIFCPKNSCIYPQLIRRCFTKEVKFENKLSMWVSLVFEWLENDNI